MTKFFAVITLLVSLISLPTLGGGGWVSSGGESLIYARNPWFVKNTTQVNYCLMMDEPSFSVSKAEVQSLIQQAFQFWKEEFRKNLDSQKVGPGFARVADQEFHEVAQCDASTPLVFKLGLKTLSQNQGDDEVAYLGDPKKYIGVTIRKDYDLKTLQGRGIIYITADKGADAYTNNGQMISEAWKKPTLMRYALIHELGHFFGIAHVGSGIMSEVFMTVLLNKRMTEDFENTSALSFLNPQENFEVCRTTGFFHPDFFGAPKNANCLKFEGSVAGRKWNVSVKNDSTGSFDLLGVVQINYMDQSPYTLQPAVVVQLPPEQSVFSAVETVMGPFLLGGVFSETSYLGSFVPKGTVRGIPLHMALSAEKIVLVGAVNNQQMTVMNFAPLSFLRAIFP